MLTESYEYAKEALWEKWRKWILLIISAIIFPCYWIHDGGDAGKETCTPA